MQDFRGDNGEILDVAPDTILIPNNYKLKKDVFAAIGAALNPQEGQTSSSLLSMIERLSSGIKMDLRSSAWSPCSGTRRTTMNLTDATPVIRSNRGPCPLQRQLLPGNRRRFHHHQGHARQRRP